MTLSFGTASNFNTSVFIFYRSEWIWKLRSIMQIQLTIWKLWLNNSLIATVHKCTIHNPNIHNSITVHTTYIYINKTYTCTYTTNLHAYTKPILNSRIQAALLRVTTYKDKVKVTCPQPKLLHRRFCC
jgi:hypothetical protein